MAPEEQMMMRWPSLRRATAVSTMVDRVDRRGSWVFSLTMEDVPDRIYQYGILEVLGLGSGLLLYQV
jgi:hypothetical protein